jgi:hypothetical protein
MGDIQFSGSLCRSLESENLNFAESFYETFNAKQKVQRYNFIFCVAESFLNFHAVNPNINRPTK